jgi:NADH dehydrogenase
MQVTAMSNHQIHAVTGAYGYSGRYIAEKLLAGGKQVITLTNSARRQNPFGDRIRAFGFNFKKPDLLADSLKDVKVLYNTYWVRFNHKLFTYANAVENSKILFDAARQAGVERIVHISITNPTIDSALEYFRGKALLEKYLKETGLSYCILRPAVLFGKEDILINNIAWALRRFPVFGVFGDGHYKLQPIYVDDLAELAVQQGEKRDNVTIDAIGPETFTYRGLVEKIGHIIGKKRPMVSLPPLLNYSIGWIVGKFVNDVMITKDEVQGLMANLLYVETQPAGTTKLTDWAKKHANTLGFKYTSELARRKDRDSEYMSN